MEKQARRLMKGALILAWILVLVSFGVLAASGRASKAVLGLFDSRPRYEYNLGRGPGEPSPGEYLANYLRKYDSPPPLEGFLDQVVPSWSERNIAKHFRAALEGESPPEYSAARSRWLADQYNSLFERADSTLRALVSDASTHVDGQSIPRPRIPSVFEDETSLQLPRSTVPTEISLSHEVSSWIKEQRIREEQARARDSLVETFFLLIVLGAFGSLIFLSKDYIEREEQTPLAAYVFRPVLGMFLAVAVFIIDIAAHSIISTASIVQTRHETLYLLALAAGLLSDQAYSAVSMRANAALEAFRKRKDFPPAPENQQSRLDQASGDNIDARST